MLATRCAVIINISTVCQGTRIKVHDLFLVTCTQNVVIELFLAAIAVNSRSFLSALNCEPLTFYVVSSTVTPFLPAIQSRAIWNVGLSQQGRHMHPLTASRFLNSVFLGWPDGRVVWGTGLASWDRAEWRVRFPPLGHATLPTTGASVTVTRTKMWLWPNDET